MGSHILGIYRDGIMLNEAILFLTQGWQNGESIAIISQKWNKDKIRQQLSKAIGPQVEKFEDDNTILITSTREWYMPNGKADPSMIINTWKKIASMAQKSGKSGIRVFVDTRYFFENGHTEDLLDYEKTLPHKFDTPINAICAYSAQDMAKLNQNSFKMLRKHHDKTLIRGLGENLSGAGKKPVKEPVLRMILLESIGNSVKNKIIRCLMQNHMTGEDLAKCTDVPNTTFYRNLNELIDDGIVTNNSAFGKSTKFRVVYSSISSVVEKGTVNVYVKK